MARLISLIAAAAAGCGQADPPTTTGAETTAADMTGGETETGGFQPGEGELGSFYPLVDGATWTYVAMNDAGQVSGTEIVEATATTFEGGPAFLFVDNPNGSGEWTESTIRRSGTAALRVYKERKTDAGPFELVEYDPGFMRFDDAWTEIGGKGELMYQRTETDGMGSTPDVEMRGHIFTVVGLDESVTVPAGTFDCIAVERVRTTGMSAGEKVLFWYAAGIGKVREERPAEGRIEALTAVSIPGGAVFP